jgi:hypothetical protein
MASYTINGNDKSDNEILEALKLDYPIKSSVSSLRGLWTIQEQ